MMGRLALLIALLAGWQAALEHPIRHVDESGAFVHLHDGHSHQDESDGSASGTGCAALAALVACAPGAAQPLAIQERAEGAAAACSASAPRLAEAPPFLSQGPPAHA